MLAETQYRILHGNRISRADNCEHTWATVAKVVTHKRILDFTLSPSPFPLCSVLLLSLLFLFIFLSFRLSFFSFAFLSLSSPYYDSSLSLLSLSPPSLPFNFSSLSYLPHFPHSSCISSLIPYHHSRFSWLPPLVPTRWRHYTDKKKCEKFPHTAKYKTFEGIGRHVPFKIKNARIFSHIWGCCFSQMTLHLISLQKLPFFQQCDAANPHTVRRIRVHGRLTF